MVAEMLQKSKKKKFCFTCMLYEVLFLLYISYLCYMFFHVFITYSYLYHVFYFCCIFLFSYYFILTFLFSLYVQNCFNAVFLLQQNIFWWFDFFMLYENFYMIFTGHSAVEMWSSIFINLTRVLYQICLADCSRLHYQIYLMKMII